MAVPTKERLTEAAAKRFYRDGFRNVGLDQVLADVGISKTAFYKHYESKDDLVIAVLEERGRWLENAFREMVRDAGGNSGAGRLRALVDTVERIIDSDEFQGCIFVNASMEYPLLHEPAHQAAARHKRTIETLVEELAAGAGAADPVAMAREFCLILEGCYVTRHVTGDKGSIGVLRRVVELLLAAHLPAAAFEEECAAGAN